MKKGSNGPILVNIGFGNVIAVNRVVTILTSASAPMKRLREEAKKVGKLIDATEGRRTRSIIVTDSDHVVLSSLQTETLTQRLMSQGSPEADNDK
ncbi:MAG: DUF370 domain-containing protein [Candidatus Magnetobacterium sp. LHC-1]|uniref:Putative regulatory protein HWQ67_07390 n=1 Tax=Candidatus Magnetobacterium casense TaxID=1455061 RepID=A0ABS6RXQ0_9BACT|nr:DUF370 domain-containing protein [Candidatus Magnetobacterium casensis]MBF0338811.1 DUF370 domain-containing protein [Nitrospirota bacterium]MBF0608392.1 DUF370 domain-containing protein [Nitrospirota bacterium]MBV6341405.1 DUF370 domain-containing protein [Candidatus Magnetobacterium casensis]